MTSTATLKGRLAFSKSLPQYLLTDSLEAAKQEEERRNARNRNDRSDNVVSSRALAKTSDSASKPSTRAGAVARLQGARAHFILGAPNAAGTHLNCEGAGDALALVEWLNELHTEYLLPEGCHLEGDIIWHDSDGNKAGVIKAENEQIKIKSEGRSRYTVIGSPSDSMAATSPSRPGGRTDVVHKPHAGSAINDWEGALSARVKRLDLHGAAPVSTSGSNFSMSAAMSASHASASQSSNMSASMSISHSSNDTLPSVSGLGAYSRRPTDVNALIGPRLADPFLDGPYGHHGSSYESKSSLAFSADYSGTGLGPGLYRPDSPHMCLPEVYRREASAARFEYEHRTSFSVETSFRHRSSSFVYRP